MGTYLRKVGEIATGQGGRLHYHQLLGAGLTPRRVRSWAERGAITRTRPLVYALGYVRSDLLALVWEAVLYAGPGAYLTGASGAHHAGLITHPPRAVVVATPRDCRPVAGITVHARRPAQRVVIKGVPVAPITELMVTLAAGGDLTLVRFALGNLEFRRQLDLQALLGACTRGRAGSALLRRALEQRLPQLARTRSPLEVAFLLLLEAHHLALPQMNVWIHGILVDAYWPELGLIVELDGKGNHGTAAQKRRDANATKILQGHGLTVVRFDSDDVQHRQSATLNALSALGVGKA